MVHVAHEMERRGMEQPLLIGGATTSRMHTAVKIAPQYEKGVVHVLDASRSVSVAGSLLSKEQKPGFLQNIKVEYQKLRQDFENKKSAKQYLSFNDAQRNRVKLDWQNYIPPVPSFTGSKIFDNYDLGEIRKYIDWNPFFIAWELHGRFPQILSDEKVGVESTKLYNDANVLLDKIVAENWLVAQGVIGFWPAFASGGDTVVVVQAPVGSTSMKSEQPSTLHSEAMHLEFLRQQIKKAADQPNISLADFIKPGKAESNGACDYIGAFSVTIKGIEPYIKKFEAEHDDYNKIMLQALADRLVEGFAELLHEKVRKEYWGYAKDENFNKEELIKETYTGIRPAPGYPACPDHTEKYKLFSLLGGEGTTGIHLTESLAMYPAASVCGWYFSHPKSQYFGVGKIQPDQLQDFARRKGMSIDEATKWLRPILE